MIARQAKKRGSLPERRKEEARQVKKREDACLGSKNGIRANTKPPAIAEGYGYVLEIMLCA